MIMTMMSVLSLLRTMEQLNEIAPPIVQAGPVGKEIGAVKEVLIRTLIFNHKGEYNPTFCIVSLSS
jgi:hypothetical protein